MADAFWMAHGIDDAGRAAAGHADKGELPQAAGLDYGFQVLDMPLGGKIPEVPIRLAATPCVIPHKRIAPRECAQPRMPDGRLPVQLQMRSPLQAPDQRRTIVTDCISDAHLVAACAKANLPRRKFHL